VDRHPIVGSSLTWTPIWRNIRIIRTVLELYNAPRRTGRPKLRYKDVIKCDVASFHISPQSWEALAADCSRWHASLSYGYSLSATSYAEKMEKRRAHRQQRRDGPWWPWTTATWTTATRTSAT